jgi:hypothetical protein
LRADSRPLLRGQWGHWVGDIGGTGVPE